MGLVGAVLDHEPSAVLCQEPSRVILDSSVFICLEDFLTFVQYYKCKLGVHFRFDTILLDKADAYNFEVFRISCQAIICCYFS